VLKRCIFSKNIPILSMLLILLHSGNTFAFPGDKDVLIFNNDYFLDSSSINQSNKDESATISSTNFLSSQSPNVNLRSAHKYLGYATAALSGITAASFSSKGFHEVAGYTTAGLSLITTAIGFYEYGEYLDLDEGFSGYNMHMIFETIATVGFIATAALQDGKSAHAAIGGVSTAMMILPIFVVHW
jgi:hypothetical protein